jgi:transketolase
MNHPDFHLNPDWATSTPASTRDGFGNSLKELAALHQNLVVLTADLADSLKLEPFVETHPDRFFDLGIAEQNLVGIAAGLASTGLIPLACSYAVFSPGRNWDQLRVSVAYSNANVKIISSHAGLSTGPDGAVHQALEDIALTRVLPNVMVVSPADALQAEQATKAIVTHRGPVYLRLHRHPGPILTTKQTPFELGKAQIVRFGTGVTLIATGLMVAECLKAADTINAEVINIHTIKPLDVDTIIASVKKTGKLIVAEEHQQAGGLGSAVVEALSQIHPVPTHFIAVPDQFGQSGTPEELFQAYGLTWEHIIKTAQSF